MKLDVRYRFLKNTRCRIHQALKNNVKLSSSNEFLGFDIDTYKRWIEHQFTMEKKWSIIEIDHVKPIRLKSVCSVEKLKEALNWINDQPLI